VILGAALALAAGCTVTAGDGYGGDGSLSVGAGYYEPFGFDYSNWGLGYGGVGPYGRRGMHPGDGGGNRGGRGFQGAASGRATPSIPSGARSGGGRAGGGRSGGGGSRR
jgi:hypothetical protein